MTERPPTLAEQIEAVAWAGEYADQWARRSRTPKSDIAKLKAALEAAAETLKHLDFMRETLT